jgi:hypothetical protein
MAHMVAQKRAKPSKPFSPFLLNPSGGGGGGGA